jgi:hypothetical protein
MPTKPRQKRRSPNRAPDSPKESVAVIPSPGVSAPADLAARFSSVLADAEGRSVSADALFDTLKLEALDWGIDNNVETRLIDTAETPVTAGDGKEEA